MTQCTCDWNGEATFPHREWCAVNSPYPWPNDQEVTEAIVAGALGSEEADGMTTLELAEHVTSKLLSSAGPRYHVLHDLLLRTERAHAKLLELAESKVVAGNEHEYERLLAKADGVKLVMSYIEEELRP